jgi:hypothetical protein
MSTSKEGETPPPPKPTPEQQKQHIVDGFRAISEAHTNYANHINAYATWITETDMSEAALQLQIELLQSLHAKLQ